MRGSNAAGSHSAAFGSPAQISDRLISTCVGKKTGTNPLSGLQEREEAGRPSLALTQPWSGPQPGDASLRPAPADFAEPEASAWGAAVPATLRRAANEIPRESTALLACPAVLPAAKHLRCQVSSEMPHVRTVCTAPAVPKHVSVLPSPGRIFYTEKETLYFPLSHLKSSWKSMAGG